jgi:hypothetical protein
MSDLSSTVMTKTANKLSLYELGKTQALNSLYFELVRELIYELIYIYWLSLLFKYDTFINYNFDIKVIIKLIYK